jgi:cytochrome c peroxidase
MKRFIVPFACLFVLGATQVGDPLLGRAKTSFSPIPSSPPAIPNNEITPAKVDLGKMLYFDPRLSASQLLSCNSCHNLGLAGVDIQQTSTGHGWQKGPRNAPTVLNSAYNAAQFWDGRAADLREQAKGPIQAGVEMNNTPDRVVATLRSMPEYVERFSASFPDESEPLTFDNVARAIEAFEATLITPDSDFDHYLAGDPGALTPAWQSSWTRAVWRAIRALTWAARVTSPSASSSNLRALFAPNPIRAATKSPGPPLTNTYSGRRRYGTWP